MPGTAGDIFAVVHRAAPGLESRGQVLFLPAFGEEHNRCRRTVSVQARRLAKLGFECWVFDLYGTGDSQGEFRDASWDIWVNDTAGLIEKTFERSDGRAYLIGLRFGALLGLSALAQSSRAVDSIVFWQPVVSGAEEIKQLERLEMLSGVVDTTQGEPAKSIVHQAQDGDDVEVAGYEISARLILDVAEQEASTYLDKVRAPMDWIEVVSEQTAVAPKRRVRLADELLDGHRDNRFHSVPDNKFWATSEITEGRKVMDLTEKILTER